MLKRCNGQLKRLKLGSFQLPILALISVCQCFSVSAFALLLLAAEEVAHGNLEPGQQLGPGHFAGMPRQH